jgi:hypothetical protein
LKLSSGFFAVALACLSLACSAQNSSTTPTQSVADQLKQSENEVLALKTLHAALEEREGLQAEVLSLRLDTRFIRLDKLRSKVAGLSNDLDELTGQDRIVASAEADLLDGLVERYLQSDAVA